jgi:DNA-binding CsgD family transcriptional regulator
MSDEIILAIGSDGFSRILFRSARNILSVRHLVAYRCRPDAPVETLFAESANDDETMRRMIHVYSQGHYARDPIREHLGPAPGRQVSIQHVDAATIQDDVFRKDLYLSQKMASKTAILVRRATDTIVISLFRGEDVGTLSGQQWDYVNRNAAYIGAAVERHLELVDHRMDDGWLRKLRQIGGASPLSSREMLVCCRILEGYLNEGIALGMAISVHSVITYRRRAFAKLGISTQNELFNLVLRGRPH